MLTFTGVILIVSLQVLLRYLFNFGLIWAQEISELMILGAYFFGISYVYKSKQYLVIDVLFEKFNDRVKVVLFVISQILTILFCMMLFVELLGIAPGQLRMKTYILRFPQFYSSIPLLIASASMVLTSIYYLIKILSEFNQSHPSISFKKIEESINLYPNHSLGRLL